VSGEWERHRATSNPTRSKSIEARRASFVRPLSSTIDERRIFSDASLAALHPFYASGSCGECSRSLDAIVLDVLSYPKASTPQPRGLKPRATKTKPAESQLRLTPRRALSQ